MRDTLQQLSPTTIWLHWIVALLMIFLTGLGIYMEAFEAENLFDLHISLGVLILLPVIVRVIWRFSNGWPAAAGDYSRFEHFSGKLVHWLLLLATLLMPLSGVMMAIAGGHGLHVFGLELAAENINLSNPGEPEPLSPLLMELGESIHSLGADILPVAIALHIIGSFKHHWIDKDRTLLRMLPWKK